MYRSPKEYGTLIQRTLKRDLNVENCAYPVRPNGATRFFGVLKIGSKTFRFGDRGTVVLRKFMGSGVSVRRVVGSLLM